jgi:hypothetical protein
MSTHHFGVQCGVCEQQLEPDDCCGGKGHGSTLQQPNEWATRTWPNHTCFNRDLDDE